MVKSAHTAAAERANHVGVKPRTSIELMANHVGGREHIGITLTDYNNYLRDKWYKEMKLGDAGGVLEYFKQLQSEDHDFYYEIQVDEDELITNIIWVDGMMKEDYGLFGDVVCFDTTYRKNEENMPFALFVGMNHHKQTIIFGATLLFDETIETFK